MRTAIFIQARMGASRLPGKPLKKVLGKPLLIYLLERLKRVQNSDLISVLTTIHPRDDTIVDASLSQEVQVFRGSEENVLDRFYQAAKKFQANTIVRITADCPLADPSLISSMIDTFNRSNFDYFCNTFQRSYPRGLDVEIFSFKALEEAWRHATEPYEKEHVTPYIYKHPEKFKIGEQTHHEDLSSWRWTVDTQEDFIVVSKLIASLYPRKPCFNFHDLIQVAKNHPEWMAINAHIAQKQLPSAK